MQYTFWGSRGSVPTPLTPDEVRQKISTVLSRVRAEDLASPAHRETFLNSLPQWVFGTTGGNTTSFQVRLQDGTELLFDAGSGLRELARARMASKSGTTEYHLFFTHFHYDHLQGLPFFVPCYLEGFTVHFYSPVEGFKDILTHQMRHPYFPVTMEGVMQAELDYHTLPLTGSVQIGNARITWKAVNHPGGAFAYRIEEHGKVLIFCPDVALGDNEFQKTEENINFFDKADVLILDAQYTLGEALEKFDWGHSSYSLGVEFASGWNIDTLFLFHHEPLYDDRKLDRNLQAAKWYAERAEFNPLEVNLAREGETHEL